ncbi:hypothetical protein AALP_AA8G289900 [Arabis alpina]|uniref:ADP-ribosyl cyclase/cyclic ADP-ribose hydrolase n=1 Tax=Arabis alpina TaxID=50452 RepID=A0A087GA57_ARAAL|nr:hypothetical protein AALP_AA8G289900 [Arabis alpina]
MASSSSSPTWKYDVFPSFSGEDVRKTFLSHFLQALKRKSIISFIDNGIERSHLIADELLLAIRQSRISIVLLSNKYASSTWCLNELVAIHKCFKKLDQMVIPVFYGVDPSDVRKQTGKFGKAFEETCKGNTEDDKKRWKKALAKVAGIAGYDSQNWSNEAEAIELISKDVLNKLLFTPSDDFGPSGIGKSTIARALYSRLSSKFDHRAFVSYKRTMEDDYSMKLSWVEQFLSEILGQKNLKIESFRVMEQRLKHSKVLIVLDDVDEIELLDTLVGRTEWFGFGSRIIVVTQDRALLKSHEIKLVHEVEFPSEDLALQMFCQSAFRRNCPPDGFEELAAEVAYLAGNLPLGLNVLGLSLRGKDKEEWVEMMPRLRGLNGKIEKTLRVSYDGLDAEDQELFLYIACLLNGHKVSYIRNMLGDRVNSGLRMLNDKSLIHVTSSGKIVAMHNLLQMLGREIVRGESTNNPGKRRFLVDAEDICDVLNDNTGTEAVLGICMKKSKLDKMWEGTQQLGSLKKMSIAGSTNLIEIPDLSYAINLEIMDLFRCTSLMTLPSSIRNLDKLRMLQMNGCSKLEVLPTDVNLKSLYHLDLAGCSQLRSFPKISKNITGLSLCGIAIEEEDSSWIENISRFSELYWKFCPLRCLPSNFRPESLAHLCMRNSKLEKLWEGVQSLGNLVEMDLSGSENLKEFPNLSKATKLEISSNIGSLALNYTAIEEVPSWIKYFSKLTALEMRGCKRLRNISSNIFELEELSKVDFSDCEGVTGFDDAEEVTEFPPALDYNNVKFEFYYRIYGCSQRLRECTCHTRACPYSVQRIKECGIQLWHVSPSRNDSCFEIFEVYRDLISSSEDEGDLIEKLCIDDYDSLPSDDENYQEYREDHPTDDELNFSSSFEEEDSDNLPTHSTTTP